MECRRLFDRLLPLSYHLLASPSTYSVRDVLRAVSPITCSSLDIELPSPSVLSSCYSPVFFANLSESCSMHACLFGFRDEDGCIPAHDHPAMHGFIKVLRGAVRVTSFSLVSGNRVRFEGTQDLCPTDDCLYLSPNSNNIHEIRSLEAGSFFFDLLVPGYKDVSCSYFRLPGVLPQPGEDCSLERCTTPVSYHCATLPFPTVFYDEQESS